MQFNLHPSHKLSLAILTAILGSTQNIAIANPAWNCVEIAGDWDCSAPNSKLKANGIVEKLAPLPSKDSLNTETVDKPLKATPPNPLEPSLTEPDIKEVQAKTTAQSPISPVQKLPSVSSTKKPAEKPQQTATAITRKTASNDFKHLDWYPYTNADKIQGVCKGRYISPTINIQTSETNSAIDLSTVFISADQSATELGHNSVLKGNVDIQQGERSLNSPLVRLNQETGELSLENGVTYRQTGLLIKAESGEGNINNDKTTLNNAQYVIHAQELRGDAKAIISRSKDILDIEDGSLTFCPPNVDDWKISASNINLDIEAGFGRADDAKLVIMGTPIIYLPYFYFPIDDRRHSGFLYPSFKFSSSETEIAIPYYFNIAPHLDDTLTATINTNESLLLENELRYLDKNSENKLSAGINAIDNKTPRERWVIGADHKGKYGKFDTVVDYTRVSDNDYFTDFGSNLDVDEGENDHINQTAKVTYRSDNWNSSILIQKYQTIDDTTTKPYQRLPEIRLSGTVPESLNNVNFNYRSVFTRFDRDQAGLTDAEKVNGDRLILNPSIDFEFSKTWGYVKPSLKLWHASYNLNDQANDMSSNQSVTLPILSVDSGLYFDRGFDFQDKAYTQTLEPRLYALYVPYEDQSKLPDFDTSELTFSYNSLFRDNRFSGDDRFGDAKQISLGLTSRVISDEGREILSASVGHAFYFEDRKVRVDPADDPIEDDISDFSTSIIWRPNTRVRALLDATFDAGSFNNTETTFDLKYEEDHNHVVGMRHRFTSDTRKQTTLSYLWPISNNWSSLGLFQYDWLTGKALDAAGGLEYQSCCWKTRFVVRNKLDTDGSRDNSFALQFILKGLGGAGRSPTLELRNKIKGYEKREYYNANN